MSTAYQVAPRPDGPALRTTIEFEPNVPVEVALKFARGKEIETRNGLRVMFSLVDGRVMFLDPEPASKIMALGARAGEKISVCMEWSGKRGEPREWTAWLSTDTELRRAQSEARENGDRWNEQKLERKMVAREAAEAGPILATKPISAVRPAATPSSTPPNDAGNGISLPPAAAQMMNPDSLALLSRCRQLVDVYWFALSYARKEYGAGVSDDAVLGIVQTAAAAGAQKKGGR